MRALVTGSLGFVGRYMCAELEQNGYDVSGLDRTAGENCIAADITDSEQVRRALAQVKPDVIIHLAGQADVGRSWREPQHTFMINTVGAANLLEAVRAECSSARVVIVGSSDEYGTLPDGTGISVTEDTPLSPSNPYAVSKRAQEELAAAYVRAYGMNICMTRSFNHSGAGQRPGFIISDLARGVAEIERGNAEYLSVGNLDSRRDYSHVRDVVRAYRLIAEKGHSGEVYNVGSGAAHSGKEILDTLLGMARCPVEVRQDAAKMRPNDTPVICCCRDKLTAHTGWTPLLGLDDILRDTLEYWREH